MQPTFAGLEMGTESFSADIAEALGKVEDLILSELTSGDDLLTPAVTHLAKAGGKRFRPLFAVLSAHFGPDPYSDDVITAAAVVELIHLATLYHDDVMDEATMRRGAQSANARWGNSVAILAGDFLFSRASRLVSTLGPESVRIVAETLAALVTGQMRETVGAGAEQDPVDHYLRTVWEKTGSLIAASGRFGSRASGAGADDVDRLSRIGDAVGVAFQVSDDIIDISSASGESGKTPGTDLREGVHTLPVLYALRDEGSEATRLRELLVAEDGSPRALGEDDAAVAEALALLTESEGLAMTRKTLQTYADRATDELAGLPEGPAHTAMSSLVRYTIERIG
ncbi:polyprenyl synthetase family protein [Gordonia jinhuaensis]|uniref:Geranylgeranyl pyrophosphate synthase n=1 Tax=Gordonia jinhuaensis TaxID=1517702 RepID=A0A916T8L9_9ACTN|nr:polyprenyl synthetase family protein [Gordonia jinhuaensis]GGB34030.1 geranylgeranyl pyrophosphate synthase [Gordonia jinhuaensis]